MGGSAKVLLGLLELTQPPVKLDQIHMRLNQLRIDFDSLLVCGNGFLKPPLSLELNANLYLLRCASVECPNFIE